MKKEVDDLVVIHPLVLLSVVDHYNRSARETTRRVVGVLLGERTGGRVDVTNSFAVPFEEDKRSPTAWFVDHNYLEEMAGMFKRINAREKIQGFYSTGPQIRPADLEIAQMFRQFCKKPVFAIIDIRAERGDGVEGLPLKAYTTVEEINAGKETTRMFKHIPSIVEAYEAEQVGVEHLLRDINDPSVSSLAGQIRHKITALKGLRSRLAEMSQYLDNVIEGRMKRNNQIIYNMQTITNLLTNLNMENLVRSILVKTNDMHLVIYISSIIRSITALHDLVNNKLKFGDDLQTDEEKAAKKKKKAAEEKKKAEEKAAAEADKKSSSSAPKAKKH